MKVCWAILIVFHWPSQKISNREAIIRELIFLMSLFTRALLILFRATSPKFYVKQAEWKDPGPGHINWFNVINEPIDDAVGLNRTKVCP
ncbi:hypothetical protein B4916_18480 [Yersinia intermedia]|nr:hypothetical protein B4916_18480 [Yersinia intermedia]